MHTGRPRDQATTVIDAETERDHVAARRSGEGSSFVVDAITLIGGTTLAQLLTLLGTPILARLYAPEAFGVFAVFNSITSIIVVVACLRYENAIMLPESDRDAVNLLAVSLVIISLFSALSALVLSVGHHGVLEWLNVPELEQYLWLLPVAIFAGGAFLPLNYWNSRTKHFRRLSIARINRSVAMTGTQLGAGFAGYGTGGGLIGGGVVGNLIATCVLGLQIWRDDHPVFRHSIDRRGMIEGMKRYRNFPLYDAGANLLNAGSSQLPVFLLSTFFSTVVVGFYSMSLMVLQLPLNFIGVSLSQVFFQRAAEARHSGGGALSRLVEGTVAHLILLGMLPVSVLMLTGGEVFSVVLGQNWAEAGTYAQILALWIFFVFISSPISSLISIYEKQRFALGYNVVTTGARAGALVAGGLIGDPRVAIMLYAGTGVAIYALANVMLLRWAEASVYRIASGVSRYLVCGIPIWSVILLEKWVFPANPLLIVVTAAAGAVLYYSILYRQNAVFRAPVENAIRKIGIAPGSK